MTYLAPPLRAELTPAKSWSALFYSHCPTEGFEAEGAEVPPFIPGRVVTLPGHDLAHWLRARLQLFK